LLRLGALGALLIISPTMSATTAASSLGTAAVPDVLGFAAVQETSVPVSAVFVPALVVASVQLTHRERAQTKLASIQSVRVDWLKLTDGKIGMAKRRRFQRRRTTAARDLLGKHP